MAKKKIKKTKKKSKRIIPAAGRAYVTAGFNNTIITITDTEGNALFSGSAGKAGFKGSRKSTPFAATTTAMKVAEEATNAGLQEISVFVNGPGAGRISAIKAMKSAGLRIVSIADITALPHNGCRPKKKRRI